MDSCLVCFGQDRSTAKWHGQLKPIFLKLLSPRSHWTETPPFKGAGVQGALPEAAQPEALQGIEMSDGSVRILLGGSGLVLLRIVRKLALELMEKTAELVGHRLLQHVLIEAGERMAEDVIDLGLAEIQAVQALATSYELAIELHGAAPQNFINKC
jgi:hypothetical protein